METKKNVKIVYNLSDAAALSEAQAGRDAAKKREILATWDEIGRELIRPCDLCESGEKTVTIDLPEQGEVLTADEAIKRARVMRDGSIREARGHLHRVLATSTTAWPVEIDPVRHDTFDGEEIRRRVAKWPETSENLLGSEPGESNVWNGWIGRGTDRRGLLTPQEAVVLQDFHARVVKAGEERQAQLDATVNKDRAAQARASREAREQAKLDREADSEAYAAACGRWLVSLDASLAGAVAEGTISLSGIESRLREHALDALRKSSQVDGLTMDEPDGGSDERALPNHYAADAAGIIQRVRESLGEVGEFVGWSAMRWHSDQAFTSDCWTLELAVAFRVPGYAGKRVLSVDARVSF